MVTAISCQSCKHLYPHRPGKTRGCDAFPDGIPMWYASGDVEHTVPMGGEVDGILYEPIDTRTDAITLMESMLGWRADKAKGSKNSKKKRTEKPRCSKGRSCGMSCIPQARKCKADLSAAADVVAKSVVASGEGGGNSKPTVAERVSKLVANPPKDISELAKEVRSIGNDGNISRATYQSLTTAVLTAWVKANATKPVKVPAQHGMTDPEVMAGIQYGNLRVWGASPQLIARQLGQLIFSQELTGKNIAIPDTLSQYTKNIFLSNQANKNDAYWEEKYKISNFRSAATGGDGNVVVYNAKPMSASVTGHEMGHNLAKAIYGKTAPPSGSDFDVALKQAEANNEGHPTDYAKASVSEDFAESVKTYLEGTLATISPSRNAVIREILNK